VLQSDRRPASGGLIIKLGDFFIDHMVRVTFCALVTIFFAPIIASAQEPPEKAALAAARQHLRKGEACFEARDMDCARREFDRAIDAILELGVDVRSDQQLNLAMREMIETINRYQLAAFSDPKLSGWRTQDYDGRPASEEVAQAEGEEKVFIPNGPLSPGDFQRQFAELRRLFREKYGRDITLTGADHGEHRRLYGRGSAYDIRARDLNRAQVNFIIATGTRLGLRIKDFSTWSKVTSHNARVISLGRPLDTLATGLHLHIDRMGPPKRKSAASRPVSKKTQGKVAPTKDGE
jgi:hypothetical protein